MQLPQSYHRIEHAKLEQTPLFEVNWYFLHLMQFSSNSLRFETYFAHLPRDSSQPPGTYTHKTGSEDSWVGGITWAQTTSSTTTHIPSFATSKKKGGKKHIIHFSPKFKTRKMISWQCDLAGFAATPVALWCSCAYTCFTTCIAHYPTSRLQPTTLTWTPTPQKKVTTFPLSLWLRLHCQK